MKASETQTYTIIAIQANCACLWLPLTKPTGLNNSFFYTVYTWVFLKLLNNKMLKMNGFSCVFYVFLFFMFLGSSFKNIQELSPNNILWTVCSPDPRAHSPISWKAAFPLCPLSIRWRIAILHKDNIGFHMEYITRRAGDYIMRRSGLRFQNQDSDHAVQQLNLINSCHPLESVQSLMFKNP